jgi:hypothetical protein
MDLKARLFQKKPETVDEDGDATPLMPLGPARAAATQAEEDLASVSSSQDSLAKLDNLERMKDLDYDSDASYVHEPTTYIRHTRHRRRWRLMCCATCGFVLL